MNETDQQTDAGQAPSHQAEQLTGGGNTAQIEHLGQTYTLRITRAGKLILTK
ncbi:hemin uptake protein HemP [Oceanicola sp. 22II-s10i]|uniref:hemin uptake protein HemP n=1 Tax=Oceanicola sp. 22II-s10i TaxID=1317116 RepID=UPI0020CE6411|nr:hemin uptake protein HemP [Oceanicola sp. 22II-s10i]